MTDTLTPVLTANWGDKAPWKIAEYEAQGGYDALRKALTMTQDEVMNAVKDSGLRGRGGAGFPTGMKWSFVPQSNPNPKYLVVNGDESEPGTCKDIPLMMATPHTLVEGVIIASYAIRAHHAFIYIRGEVLHVHRRMQQAVRDAYAKGYLGTVSYTHLDVYKRQPENGFAGIFSEKGCSQRFAGSGGTMKQRLVSWSKISVHAPFVQ